jgi:hypothetical protein
MTQPNISTVVDDTVSGVDSAWDATNTSGDKPVIDKADEIGKGRDLSVYDYVEFSKTNPNAIEYHDLPMNSQDIDAAVFAELKSSSEARRDELFDEFRRTIEAKNDEHGFVYSDFDRVVFADVTFLDDGTFSAYLVEVTLLFEARGRSVEV